MAKNIFFPYPVLKYDDTSGYNDNSILEIAYDDYEILSNNIQINVDLTLVSNTIKTWFINESAELFIKMCNDIYQVTEKIVLKDYCYKENGYYDNVYIKMPLEYFTENDELKIVAYIVAKKNFQFIYNDEFDSIFNVENFLYEINKNDILAISNEISLTYNATIDLIKICKSDKHDGKGYEIILNSPDYIQIMVSPQFNNAYAKISNYQKKVSNLISANLAFSAISYALTQICLSENKEDYKEKIWYKKLYNSIPKNNICDDLDDFIEEKGPDNFNIAEIYEYTHIIISNFIEKSILRIEEGIKK
ncbi:MAG TPA: hypothetical protein GX708_19705 [Gallicola sp.]|nr:hypothetical protein [Gallicola sp.]